VATTKKNIVILGGGFGGIVAALRVGKGLRQVGLTEKYGVTVIDRNERQAYTPVLYEHAAAPKDEKEPNNITLDIARLLKGLPVDFMKGEVAEIDLMNGDVHLKTGGEIKAEFAIIALGSEVNYFGIPGMAEHATPLKTFADAERIRAALQGLLAQNKTPRVVIGGAGPNGIELAGQIKHLHPQCDITIVEAMPEILPGFAPRMVKLARKRLTRLGIKIAVNSKIASVETNAIKLGEGADVPFDLMVWTGGVKAPDLVSKLPLRAERGKPVAEFGMGCVPQTPDLKLYPMVYVIGDSVCFYDSKTGKPMPTVAPVAIEQAEVVAHNVLEEIKKAEQPAYTVMTKNYSAQEYPYVIPIGGHWAAAKIGPVFMTGYPGWIFKRFVELDYLITVMPFFTALGAWMK